MKKGFYKVSYIPNKLVYVWKVEKGEIHFLAFLNSNGEGMKAVRHSALTKLKGDFKPEKNHTPLAAVTEMIKKEIGKEI